MIYRKPIIETIKARKSCRSFDTREIDESEIKDLCEYINVVNAETKSARLAGGLINRR